MNVTWPSKGPFVNYSPVKFSITAVDALKSADDLHADILLDGVKQPRQHWAKPISPTLKERTETVNPGRVVRADDQPNAGNGEPKDGLAK